MFNYLDNIPLNDEEKLSEERVENIKTSVLSRIKKEENAMSKRTTIKTLTIAVAAATTAALSAMIASAEQSAWTPASDVEETLVADVEETSEAPEITKVAEVAAEAKTDEAKEDENLYGWVEINPDDLVYMQPDDDPNVYYIYHKISEEQLKEMLGNGWTLLDEDINVIHENEVFADD